ncbi:MAG: Nif11-like leader peptide family natural product precursor [Gemmataceae bacterium]
MSVEKASEFINLLPREPALQAEVRAVPQGNREEALAAILHIAQARGYSFSADDYLRAVKAHLDARQDGRRLHRVEQSNVDVSLFDAWYKLETLGLIAGVLFD